MNQRLLRGCCLTAPAIALGMAAAPAALAQESLTSDSSTRFFEAEVTGVCNIIGAGDGELAINSGFDQMSSRADGGKSGRIEVVANHESSLAFTVQDSLLEHTPSGSAKYNGSNPYLEIFVDNERIGTGRSSADFKPVDAGISYPAFREYTVDVVLRQIEGSIFSAGKYQVKITVTCAPKQPPGNLVG